MFHLPAAHEVSLDSLIKTILPALPDSVFGLDYDTLVSNVIQDAGKMWLPQDTSTTGLEAEFLKFVKGVIWALMNFQPNGVASDVTFRIVQKSIPLDTPYDPPYLDKFFYLERHEQGSNKGDWADIIMPIECDSAEDECDEINSHPRVMRSMHHVMRNDPRRQFMLGLTCGNTKARLWYHNRCHVVASEEIDINKDRTRLVRIILSVLLAPPDRLGVDPDMELVPLSSSSGPDVKPSYNITIRNTDTGEANAYRTLNMISSVETKGMLGPGTRLWVVQKLVADEPSGPCYMLKDTWLHKDYVPEHVILKELRGTQPLYSQHFPTPLDHGFGSFSIAAHDPIYGIELVPTNNILIVHSDVTDIRNQEGLATLSKSIGHPPPPGLHPEGDHDFCYPNEHPCKHYRIVLKEIGTPVRNLRNFSNIFTAIQGGLKGVYAMHLCKYVHRDINSDNILLVASSESSGGRGVIMGLEYAKKIDDTSVRHDVETGIAAFMATEVSFMEHFRLEELRDLPVCFPRLPGNAESPPDCNDKPLPPFRYNPLHDMESIWWVCIWTMLCLAPAGRSSAVQLKNYYRIFRSKHSRHYFICHPVDFKKSTTHLEETPSFVELMKIWAQSLNYFYGVSYMQQDASEAHLTRIQIDDKTIEAAYNRGNDILERLKQACELLSTRFVTLAESSYDETSAATTQQSTSNTSTSVTESPRASCPALTTKRQTVKPAASTARRHKNGPPAVTTKGPKRGISPSSTKKRKVKSCAKAASGEPDFWIELPPVHKKARTKPNGKVN